MVQWFLEQWDCTPAQSQVLSELVKFADPDGTNMYPGIERLCRITKLSNRCVIDALKYWRDEVKVLKRTRRGNRRTEEADVYAIDLTFISERSSPNRSFISELGSPNRAGSKVNSAGSKVNYTTFISEPSSHHRSTEKQYTEEPSLKLSPLPSTFEGERTDPHKVEAIVAHIRARLKTTKKPLARWALVHKFGNGPELELAMARFPAERFDVAAYRYESKTVQ